MMLALQLHLSEARGMTLIWKALAPAKSMREMYGKLNFLNAGHILRNLGGRVPKPNGYA